VCTGAIGKKVATVMDKRSINALARVCIGVIGRRAPKEEKLTDGLKEECIGMTGKKDKKKRMSQAKIEPKKQIEKTKRI
jgi:hypothetical protein